MRERVRDEWTDVVEVNNSRLSNRPTQACFLSKIFFWGG